MIKLKPKSIKIIKTCNLYFCAVFTGMCMALTGPTLLDLQNIVNTDTKHIAFVYTARSTGYLFGSVLGGVLFDLTNKKQFILTVFNMINAISSFAIPWSRIIGELTAWMTVNGFCMGLLDTGTNVCCLYLWGKESGPYYQALHFTYGIGGLVSPLIAAPFLSSLHPEKDALNGTELVATNQSSMGPQLPNYINGSSWMETIPTITYAYSIIGGIGILVTVSFFIVCMTSPIDDNCQKAEDNLTRPRSFGFVFVIVLLNFLLLFVETGTEIGFAQMVTTYAVKGPLKLTKTVGSYITSTFWAAFTLSRFISVFLAIKFSNRSLVIFDITVTSIGAAVLYFFAVTYEWALWLASALLGIGVASLFPSAIAWVDQYIIVTNKIVSLFAVGAAFGEMVVPYTISYFISETSEVLIYVVIASCVLSGSMVLIMYLILRNKEEKYLSKEEVSNASNQATTVTTSDTERY